VGEEEEEEKEEKEKGQTERRGGKQKQEETKDESTTRSKRIRRRGVMYATFLRSKLRTLASSLSHFSNRLILDTGKTGTGYNPGKPPPPPLLSPLFSVIGGLTLEAL
jgi:hypothetical protein